MLSLGILRGLTVLLWLVAAAAIAQPQTSRASSASSYLERGDQWLEKGDWDRAIADYDLAIAFERWRAAVGADSTRTLPNRQDPFMSAHPILSAWRKDRRAAEFRAGT